MHLVCVFMCKHTLTLKPVSGFNIVADACTHYKFMYTSHLRRCVCVCVLAVSHWGSGLLDPAALYQRQH